MTALGIPPERHDVSSLSSFFPPEFNVKDFGLSQRDIAEVLLSFVEQGLVSLTGLADQTVRRAHCKHVCHFYRDEDEMLQMTARFLEEGLRSGERCLWILPEWLKLERARKASRSLRVELDEAEALGRIFFFTQEQVYLDTQGVIRSATEIIDFWLDEERNARALGFSGIRITGDGTDLVSTDAWSSGVDYERLADEAFVGQKITALCTYSLANLPADRLASVLTGHSCGYIRRNGTWDEIRNGTGLTEAIEFYQNTVTLSDNIVT